MKELIINDILLDEKNEVQSIKKAVKKKDEQTEILEFENKFKSKGRPKVEKKDKKILKSVYLSPLQINKIERVAQLSGLKLSEYMLFCIKKEMRREGVEL